MEIDEKKRKKIQQKIRLLRTHPEMLDIKPLEKLTFFRIKIAEYRVICRIDSSKNIVRISYVGHRKDVYRKCSRWLDSKQE